VDAWSLLVMIAARTSRVRLGTMLTPLPWRRPWKVASQVATLDQLSGGRAILSVGLGALVTDLPDTGEVTGTRPRADLMDEGIDLIRGLWAGRSSYKGQHYRYECSRSDLTEVGLRAGPDPDLGGGGPRPCSMQRALRATA
jgi:alkanesulfonate monooxygenase SsuD/methylene tetrahydromethanopterin reductase-like flavin-dependent oxidoreductase (luciferase family)